MRGSSPRIVLVLLARRVFDIENAFAPTIIIVLREHNNARKRPWKRASPEGNAGGADEFLAKRTIVHRPIIDHYAIVVSE